MSSPPTIDPARRGITDREALQWAVQAALCSPRSSLVACQGGLVNQVWRVFDPSGRTFILKRAADHLARAPEVALELDRQRVEALALERVWPLLAPELAVPAKLAYDPAQGMVAMQDMGQAPALDVWLMRARGPGRGLGASAWPSPGPPPRAQRLLASVGAGYGAAQHPAHARRDPIRRAGLVVWAPRRGAVCVAHPARQRLGAAPA